MQKKYTFKIFMITATYLTVAEEWIDESEEKISIEIDDNILNILFNNDLSDQEKLELLKPSINLETHLEDYWFNINYAYINPICNNQYYTNFNRRKDNSDYKFNIYSIFRCFSKEEFIKKWFEWDCWDIWNCYESEEWAYLKLTIIEK